MQNLNVDVKRETYEFHKEVLLPRTWTITQLSDLCEILDGQRIPIEESERKKRKGMYPYYGASGIIDYMDGFIFNERLLCLAEDGENLRSRVLPVAFTIDGKTWVNNHAHVLRPKKEKTDHQYLEYFLNYKLFDNYLSFTAQPKLTQEAMRKIRIILPNIGEQQKIASILSKVDELIKKTDQLIEQTRRLKKGLMQRLFTKGIGHTKFKKT
ncbi:MAG: restriction endonuclease subunit S [Candidatus Nitrosopolaris sp.]